MQQGPTSSIASRVHEALTELRGTIDRQLEEGARRLVEITMATDGGAASGIDTGRLRASLAVIDASEDQADALARLLEQASLYAARVGLLTLRGESLQGWAEIGFDAAESSFESLDIALEGPWSRIVRSGKTATGPARELATLPEPLGAADDETVAWVPFVLRGTVQAMLYADQGGGSEELAVDELQILCHSAAQTVACVAVREGSASALDRIEKAAELAATAPPEPPDPLPEATDERLLPPPPDPPAEATIDVEETEPRPNLVQPPTELSGPGSAFQRESSEAGKPRVTTVEEARRQAELLVSEIELYNQERLAEARLAGNIYARLGDDIEQARAMYHERVAPQVAESTEFFDEEILRVLAQGDAAQLGR